MAAALIFDFFNASYLAHHLFCCVFHHARLVEDRLGSVRADPGTRRTSVGKAILRRKLCVFWGKGYRVTLSHWGDKITHPPRTIAKADGFLYNREGRAEHNERCVYIRNFLDETSSHIFRCVSRPMFWRKTGGSEIGLRVCVMLSPSVIVRYGNQGLHTP